MIVAVFLSSAITVDNKLEVGKNAPEIETINGNSVINDEVSEGKTKLISFWSPKKPASRIANKNFSLKYGENSGEDIEFISICTDSDEDLMREVMKIDGINIDKSYSYSEISSRVFKDYAVEENPRAFMISEEGKIISIL